jgi:hypothetical protein
MKKIHARVIDECNFERAGGLWPPDLEPVRLAILGLLVSAMRLVWQA